MVGGVHVGGATVAVFDEGSRTINPSSCRNASMTF